LRASAHISFRPGDTASRHDHQSDSSDLGGKWWPAGNGVFEEATPTAPTGRTPQDSGDAADLSIPQGFRYMCRKSFDTLQRVAASAIAERESSGYHLEHNG